MGLFGSLLEKKVCSICGGDAGRVFTKKLDDGILCKECAGRLSPWFSDRRSSTVAQIQEQLDYREANKEKVADFNVTTTLNGRCKVLLDEDAGNFIVTSAHKWREANPDVIPFDQVTGVTWEVDESKIDVTPQPDAPEDGSARPAVRPQDRIYEYHYDFYVTINLNNPYFSEIRFQANDETIENKYGPEYRHTADLCEEVKTCLTSVHENVRAAAVAAAAPKKAVVCPGCGATTFPDENGRCEYCGGALGA